MADSSKSVSHLYYHRYGENCSADLVSRKLLSDLARHCKRFEIGTDIIVPEKYTADGFSEALREPLIIGTVLAEELAFLESHSSLLLKTKKTIAYFKQVGKLVLDITNQMSDRKPALFHEIRRPRRII